MYHFTNPLKNVYSLFFQGTQDKSYIGQIIMKDGYIFDITVYDCSHTDFMKEFLFELGVDQVYAHTKKCYREYYGELGFKVIKRIPNKMIYKLE